MVVGNVHALAIEERSFQLPQLESLSSLSNNGVIHYPFTCLDAAARKKMHSNAAGLSRPNSPARLYSYSVP